MSLSSRQANNLRPEHLMGYLGAAKGDSETKVATAAASTSMAISPSSSSSAPSTIASKVIPVNNAIANALAPFGPIIDLIPNPPTYKDFTKDFKVRPVDALVNLFTPMDWFLYDAINEANAASSVHAGSARRIGLPGRQVDFVMGTGLPPGLDATTAAYTKRLIALENFLILAYQDPVSLAKGIARAMINAANAGVVSAQELAANVTGILQEASKKVTLFNGVNEGVVAPDNRFVEALAAQFKTLFPGLKFLDDARKAADAAKAALANAARMAQEQVQAAQAKAQQAANDLAAVTPVVTRYTAFISGIGGGPLHLNEAMAAWIDVKGDTEVKNQADQIKALADNVRKGVTNSSAKALMTQVYDNAEHVKQVASDIQGKRDNWGNKAGRLPYLLSQASALWRAPVVLLPTTLAGYRGMGDFGLTPAVAAVLATYSGPTAGTAVVSGGTAGVATAPATTPGIAGLIQSILGPLTGGMAIPGVTGGGASAAPTISVQPQSVSVASGAPATFSVTAAAPPAGPLGGGSALTYQWLKNNVPIPGATQSSVTVPATPNYDGSPDQISVKVSAGTASVVSQPALLRITSGAGVPGQPEAQKSTLAKVAPYALAAGAVVALPVLGPVAAAALAVGAGVSALSKPKGQAAPPSQNTLQGYKASAENLNALLAGLGAAEDPSGYPTIQNSLRDVSIIPGQPAVFRVSVAPPSGGRAIQIKWELAKPGKSFKVIDGQDGIPDQTNSQVLTIPPDVAGLLNGARIRAHIGIARTGVETVQDAGLSVMGASAPLVPHASSGGGKLPLKIAAASGAAALLYALFA